MSELDQKLVPPSVQAIAPSRKERSAMRNALEYAAAWGILHGLGLLPRRAAIKLGQAIGALVLRVHPRLARHAIRNLQLALPALSSAEQQQLIRGVFANLGRLLGEVTQFPKLNRAKLESIVAYEGLEHYVSALKQGRGVILLTGHIGAWELSVYAHSINGYPMSFLKRTVDNPLVEQLGEQYRNRFGNRSIDKKGGLREVLRTLKAGGVVGILADLNASREEGVFVDFFGLPTCATAGVATLALRTGALVVPGYLLWDEAAQIHRLHFEAPLETIQTGNQKADVQANTQQYVKVLERVIRQQPDQWLWIHRRWRTRPVGEPELY